MHIISYVPSDLAHQLQVLQNAVIFVRLKCGFRLLFYTQILKNFLLAHRFASPVFH